MTEISYIGNELHLFQYAENWKKYYGNFIKPFLKGKILEVGAGIGSTTAHLCDGSQGEWLCLEPDPNLFAELEEKVNSNKLPNCCTALKGTSADLTGSQQFDAILYIDVIEHIENDNNELIQTVKHLKPGGHLIILVPAHQFLFNEFDKAIGHYRRYNKKRLISTVPAALQLKKIKYMDSLGFVASLANKLFLKQDYPTLKQINFWDKLIIPVSRISDIITFNNFGKSLIGIWQKL